MFRFAKIAAFRQALQSAYWLPISGLGRGDEISSCLVLCGHRRGEQKCGDGENEIAAVFRVHRARLTGCPFS
jgi:hypothetical protein